MGLKEELNKELMRNNSLSIVKTNLVNRGYLEDDIDRAFKNIVDIKSEASHKNNRLLGAKELFDRVGYGFASQQFINILFLISGASLFLIGFVNGIKTALTYLVSGFLKEYSRIKYFGKFFISTSGVIYGLSFLGLAFAVVIHNPMLFAVSLLLGSIGVIAHGDLYIKFYNNVLKVEHRKTFLQFISYFGIFITAFSMIAAGLLMEIFPVTGQLISFNPSWASFAEPINFKIYGYLIAFEITAIMFILSGYLMSFIDDNRDDVYSSSVYLMTFMGQYLKTAAEDSKIFIKNSKVFLLTLAAISMTIIQVVGNSFFGIFIYEHFRHQFLGGFMNVAVVFVIALVASISGTFLTRKLAKSLGEAPMLVFGTLLVALLPLTLFYNPNLYAIGLATALSIIGGAVVGVAQGLIAERLMSEKELSTYFSGLGFVSIIPTVILVTIGAILAQTYTLQELFKWLGYGLVAFVMPVYFILVLILDSEYRKEHKTSK
ncbi:MAG TPA: hypothetical protein VEC16_01520 [Alphaproteobacteria bacterium]|nr:hypothetical protein [Alphaproteobacteria bacterium]